ncbi:MAG: cob(I)yrinic acid a,c-diamide adenosyltransferase [Thermodesulfobacteriota bacterium]|nr:cob(I)yrinic acid a,c-diamide adenosyltransferase [Thermodesulfobacteriota bacterium]
MSKEKGLIIVHTGTGKGKTTAAMGMALRTVGHNLKVLMAQFIKGSWKYGELKAIKRLHPHFEIVPLGEGFLGSNRKTPTQDQIQLVVDAWEFCKEKVRSGQYNMIILDEINYVIDYGLLPLDWVLDTLQKKPARLHVVLTGRNAHPRIIEAADLVTEMRELKHPFKSGIKAQRGIEY